MRESIRDQKCGLRRYNIYSLEVSGKKCSKKWRNNKKINKKEKFLN